MAEKTATLRKIIELLGEEFLDAELSIQVVDGRNHEWMPLELDYHNFPRTPAYPQTNEPARLTIKAYLSDHRLVRLSKKE